MSVSIQDRLLYEQYFSRYFQKLFSYLSCDDSVSRFDEKAVISNKLTVGFPFSVLTTGSIYSDFFIPSNVKRWQILHWVLSLANVQACQAQKEREQKLFHFCQFSILASMVKSQRELAVSSEYVAMMDDSRTTDFKQYKQIKTGRNF